MATKVDIAIVGAGTAGLAAALTVAQQSPEILERTLVIERRASARHPSRAKAVGPRAMGFLGRLGVAADDVQSASLRGVSVSYRGRFVRLEQPDMGLVGCNESFHRALHEAALRAGVRVIEGTGVSHVSVVDGWASVHGPLDGPVLAKVVIGADGIGSVVRRTVVRQEVENPHRSAVVMRAGVPGWKREPLLHLDFDQNREGLPGFAWAVPSPCEGEPRTDFGVFHHGGEPRSAVRAWFEEWLHRAGVIGEVVIQGMLQRHFDIELPMSCAHVILAGEAIGVDPLTGHGTAAALCLGREAAKAAVAALWRERFGFGDYRERILASPMGFELGRRGKLAPRVYGPAAPYLARAAVTGTAALRLARWLLRGEERSNPTGL